MTTTSMQRSTSGNSGAAVGGGTYGLGFIGALIYFLQSADNFWDGIWGIFQALFWPAFLVFDLFDMLGT